MKKAMLVLALILVALLLAACDSKPKIHEYQGLKGEVTGTVSYECPKCHTYTLKVEAGKSYGICSSCDEKYYIK